MPASLMRQPRSTQRRIARHVEERQTTDPRIVEFTICKGTTMELFVLPRVIVNNRSEHRQVQCTQRDDDGISHPAACDCKQPVQKSPSLVYANRRWHNFSSCCIWLQTTDPKIAVLSVQKNTMTELFFLPRVIAGTSLPVALKGFLWECKEMGVRNWGTEAQLSLLLLFHFGTGTEVVVTQRCWHFRLLTRSGHVWSLLCLFLKLSFNFPRRTVQNWITFRCLMTKPPRWSVMQTLATPLRSLAWTSRN